jgi:hypothetical protein
MTRDQLRAATVGQPVIRKRRTVTLPGGDVEVIQPTVAERRDIMKAAGVKPGKGEDVDMAKLMAHSVIALTVVPGTEERVYEVADLPGFYARPTGDWFDELAEAAMKMINVSKGDPEMGNSETTTSDDSSSV